MALEDVVRPNVPPLKPRGFKAPSTTGVNDGTPTSTFGSDVVPVIPPFVSTEQGNNLQRWPQRGVSLPNVEELASVLIDVGGSFEIDPNVLNIWNLRVGGTELTLSFAALEALAADQQTSIWNGAVRVRTVEVKIYWTGGGARDVTMTGVKWGGGVQPGWTPTAGLDVILVQISSTGEKLGFVADLDVK